MPDTRHTLAKRLAYALIACISIGICALAAGRSSAAPPPSGATAIQELERRVTALEAANASLRAAVAAHAPASSPLLNGVTTEVGKLDDRMTTAEYKVNLLKAQFAQHTHTVRGVAPGNASLGTSVPSNL